MEPIKLTKFGDILVQRGNRTDDSPISPSHPSVYHSSVCIIGTHDRCWGKINIKETSETHNVLLCGDCELQIPIPKEIKTYGDLRSYLIR